MAFGKGTFFSYLDLLTVHGKRENAVRLSLDHNELFVYFRDFSRDGDRWAKNNTARLEEGVSKRKYEEDDKRHRSKFAVAVWKHGDLVNSEQ